MKVIHSSQLIVVVALFTAACTAPITEIERISNATKTIDAVNAIQETGATVATPAEVYLVAAGGKVVGEPVFRADNVSALTLSWETDSSLTIRASAARVFLQKDMSSVRLTNGESKKIRVVYGIDNLQRP